ncbi:DUF3843 family protein [Flammeovirga aprica]|uniref:DUF3843 family protein n=1 Tax=Flammeovirga aprica JL-4 TaxID=694437 RepID=A0A7X9RVI8_9BACT|nr:DUF3843 family protein [Flammeovirga aprica]NME69414.1 DUF3843 family protein [Flammeovirga aprica JL-4]
MKKQIFIKDWLKLKPYQQQQSSDLFYLRISNQVLGIIKKSEHFNFIETALDPEQVKLMSCFLTSYLEDVVSESNIWSTFRYEHELLYKKCLPFFQKLEDYYEDEINAQDVEVLIWYFINAVQETYEFEPNSFYIKDIAEDVMKVFEDAWEYAPENTTLKLKYTLLESDFYKSREFIDVILFQTYLFYPDTALKQQKVELDIFEKNRNESHLLHLLNSERDRLLHTSFTKLLGLKGKEWAAKVLGEKHPLYTSFLELSPKLEGQFFYKGQDERYVYLEYIATGEKFNLLKESYDNATDLNNVDDILYLGICKWRGEWWFSGVAMIQSFDVNLVNKERNSLESVSATDFLKINSDRNNKTLASQKKAFLEFNQNSLIKILPIEEVEPFVNSFMSFYNKSLGLSSKEVEKIRENHKGSIDQGITLPSSLKENNDSALVFFNEKTGIQMGFDINSAFPLKENSFFNPEKTREHIITLCNSTDISTELVMYCIDNFKDQLPFFESRFGRLLLNDTDFLLRFWKTKDYYSKAMVTEVNE